MRTIFPSDQNNNNDNNNKNDQPGSKLLNGRMESGGDIWERSRGDVWWHAKNARSDENAREEQGDDGFGKLKYTCDDDDEINSPKRLKGKKKGDVRRV